MNPELAPLLVASRLVIGLIVILALSYGREVLMPLALAAVLAFMLMPIVGFLTRLRAPRPAAVAVVMSAFLGVTLFGSAVFSAQVIELTASLATYRANIAEKVGAITGVGSHSGALRRAAESVDALQREFEAQAREPKTQGATRVIVDEAPAPGFSGMMHALETTLGPLEILLLTLVYAAVLLAQQYDIVDRLVRLAGVRNIPETTSALSDAGTRISRLFLAQGAINVGFGLIVGAGLGLLGIPNAALWAMAAIAFRFLPFVGVVLAAAPPLLLAAAVTPGWGLVAATLALYILTELVLSNIIEPVVLGRHTGLSPLAVIAAASFWSVVWGPVGLLLAAPLTVALVVVGDYVPSLKFLSLLLGDRPPLAPAEELYRRLLSDDAAAAVERFESEIENRAPLDVGDHVVLPALRLAARDHRNDRIPDAKAQEIAGTMAEVEELLVDTLEEHSDAMIAPVSDDARRIVIPAHGAVDAIAAAFTAFILTRSGAHCHASERASGLMALSTLKGESVETILLLSVGGVSRSHMRLLARRAVADFPTSRILLCDWGDGVHSDETADEKSLPSSIIRCPGLVQAAALLRYQPEKPEATKPLAAA